MSDKEFEEYWRKNRLSILANDEEYRRAKDNFKLNSGADMLLWGIPVVAGILFMNNVHLANELLNWIASAAVTVACFVVCMWIRTVVAGCGSPDEVEKSLKEKTRKRMVS